MAKKKASQKAAALSAGNAHVVQAAPALYQNYPHYSGTPAAETGIHSHGPVTPSPSYAQKVMMGSSAAQKPAYISIQKKASLSSSNPPSAASSPKAVQLPPSLKQYVDKVFASCPAAKLSQVQERLKLLITRAQETNTLHTTDWSKMPMPDFSSLDSIAVSSSPVKFTKNMSLSSSSSSAASSVTSSPKVAVTALPTQPAVTPSHVTGSYQAAISSMAKFKRKASVDISNVSNSPPVSPQIVSSKVAMMEVENTSRSNSPMSNIGDESRKDQRLKRFKAAEEERQRQKKRDSIKVANARMAFQMAGAEGNPDVIDWDEHTIIGTCTKLEKSYLRLTSAPDPASVRPLYILTKTLDLLKDKWKKEHNYTYICDQFKSLRQDLTVQRIKNEFTVKVYETHARIALEKGDLGEYNQCQAQLKQLYHLYHLPGCTEEFLSYRILYMIHTLNQTDLINTIGHLTPKERQSTPVQHALAVRSALATGNFHHFFKLYHQAPNMSGYLMDQFAERQRLLTLRALCRAFRPDLSLEYVASQLGFIEPPPSETHEHGKPVKKTDDPKVISRGVRACRKWLNVLGVTYVMKQVPSTPNPMIDDSSQVPYLDCKASLPLVMEKVVQMERKGVDIKGQIH